MNLGKGSLRKTSPVL